MGLSLQQSAVPFPGRISEPLEDHTGVVENTSLTDQYKPRSRRTIKKLVRHIATAVGFVCATATACVDSSYQVPEEDAGNVSADTNPDPDFDPDIPDPDYLKACDSVDLDKIPDAITNARANQVLADITEHALEPNPDVLAHGAMERVSFAIGPIDRVSGESHIVMGDRVLGRPCGGDRYVLEEIGTSSNQEVSRSAAEKYAVSSRLIDVTGDGLPDLIIAHSKSEVYLYTGRGFDGFAEPQEIYFESNRPGVPIIASTMIADVDGNGMLDLVFTRIPEHQGPRGTHYEHKSIILANQGDGNFEDISADEAFTEIQYAAGSVLYTMQLIPTIDPRVNFLWLGRDMDDDVLFGCEDMTLTRCSLIASLSEAESTMGSDIIYVNNKVRILLSQTAYVAGFELDPGKPSEVRNILNKFDHFSRPELRGNNWGIISLPPGNRLLVAEGILEPGGPPYPDDVHAPHIALLAVEEDSGVFTVSTNPDAVGVLSDDSMGRIDWHGMQELITERGPGAVAGPKPPYWTTELSTTARILAPIEPSNGITIANLAPPGTFFTFRVISNNGKNGKKETLHDWIPTSSGIAGQDDTAVFLSNIERVLEMRVRYPDGREEIIDETEFNARLNKGTQRAFFPLIPANPT